MQDPEAVVPAAEVAEASSRLWSAEEVDDDADYLTYRILRRLKQLLKQPSARDSASSTLNPEPRFRRAARQDSSRHRLGPAAQCLNGWPQRFKVCSFGVEGQRLAAKV